jgi:hypothetical protein
VDELLGTIAANPLASLDLSTAVALVGWQGCRHMHSHGCSHKGAVT